MDSNKRLIQSSLSAALLLGSALLFNASAATLYWDTDGNAAAGYGGSGTWEDGTAANWNTSNTGAGVLQVWNNANNDSATFGTTGSSSSSVTVNGSVTALRLDFGGSVTHTLSGGDITITQGTDGNAINVNNSGTTVTINNNINFTGGWRTTINSSNNVLVLNGNLNYTANTANIRLKFFPGANSGITTINGNIIKSGTGTLGFDMNTSANTGTAGTVNLNGNNTGLTLTSNLYTGKLTLGHSGALGSGSVVLQNPGTNVASTVLLLTNTGGLTIGNAITVSATDNTGDSRTLGGMHTSGTSTYSGNISVGAQTQSLGLQLASAAGGVTAFSGTISGAGNLSIVGPGVIRFTKADGNTYTGGTTVSSGTLLISNTSNSATGTGSVSVSSSATLSGNGIIAQTGSNGLSVASGATVAPGDGGIGTLTLNLGSTTGSAVFSSGGLFSFDLAAPGSGDVMAFTGLTLSSSDVQFNGNTINFNDLGGLGVGVYTLFTFDQANAYTGTLVLGTGLGSFSGNASLVYNANSIDLVIAAVPEPSTYALVGMGLGALLLLRSCKRA